MALKRIKGGKHPQKIAEEQSKNKANENANDPKKIAAAIKKLKIGVNYLINLRIIWFTTNQTLLRRPLSQLHLLSYS